MKTFVNFLKRQSPPMQLASYGHGWLELPNGQLWQPSPGAKPFKQAKRRSALSRLLGLGGKRG
ncbi:phage filamentation protein Fil family protein [Pseudomonas graminis]